MDFGTSRLYLLGEYQGDFDGIGGEVKWKPNEKLIKKGWVEE